MNQKLFDVFDIDMNHLEEECADQPLLFIYYSQKLKKAKKAMSAEKTDMEIEMAEIDLLIRQNPTKYKLPDKLTEKMITNAIIRQKRYKKAYKRYLKAKDKVDALTIYVNALEHRRRMLSDLVQLHGQQYFSKPFTKSTSRKLIAKIEEFRKQQAAAIKIRKHNRK